jgi:hypothetical protein
MLLIASARAWSRPPSRRATQGERAPIHFSLALRERVKVKDGLRFKTAPCLGFGSGTKLQMISCE